MRAISIFILLVLISVQEVISQETIPFDTTHWDIKANAYMLENYHGNDAIYIQNGSAVLRDTVFTNGTIEFDVFLTNRQSFPGVQFRIFDDSNAESFYLRPHLPGKPDANQAVSKINGLSAWQLYFGPAYSFTYTYSYTDWTHVKVVINDMKAQVYLDYAVTPHLSWHLKHPVRAGGLAIGGGGAPMHYANFKFDKNEFEMLDFNVPVKELPNGIIQKWEVSDKFEETQLEDLSSLKNVIDAREWGKQIQIDESGAANISWEATRYGSEGNTVFTKIIINASSDQLKLFEFGYSDRVVAILNGKAIYKGTNRYRTRDYRYLGTVGFFDAIYLDLKKGDNVLLLAISEDFGGWGVTGRFENEEGIKVK